MSAQIQNDTFASIIHAAVRERVAVGMRSCDPFSCVRYGI